MNMKRSSILLALLVLVSMAAFMTASSSAQPPGFIQFNLPPGLYDNIARSQHIEISVDRGEGARYNEGDPITIQYSTTGGGYINLVNYLTDGGVRILVRNQFVSAESGQEFHDTVYGPSGTERLVLLFTPDEMNDSQLESFIKQPHQAERNIGRHQLNRTHYEVIARYLHSNLIIQPSFFNTRSGDSILLTATLEDGAGNPVYGRTIHWVADRGSFNQASVVTDNSGRSVVTYYPPEVEVNTDVVVTAEFVGAAELAPVSLEIFGTVDPPRSPPPTSTLFFVDFGGGSPNYNVSNFRYSGALIHGYTTTGTAVLEMTSRDTIEFDFNPGGLPVRGLVLVWLESRTHASLNVQLNNRRVGSITPNSGNLDLDHESRIAISSADLVSGSNRMIFSVEGPANSNMAVQRIVIMF